MPETSADEPGRSTVLLVRRTFLEDALRRAVLRRSGVTYTSGTEVSGLCFATTARPRRVIGVRTPRGRLLADLVIATGGRRDRTFGWLREGGAAAPWRFEESSRLTMYSRFYQLRPGAVPGPLDDPISAGGIHDGFAAKLLLAGGKVFSVSFGILPGDPELQALREPAFFAAAAGRLPATAAWVDPHRSRPITPRPLAIGGLRNRLLRLVAQDGTPVVHGLHLAGDSLCLTNPVFALGVSVAFEQAVIIAEAVRRHPADLAAQMLDVDKAVTERIAPQFDAVLAQDRTRIERWRAAIASPAVADDPSGPTRHQLVRELRRVA
ncbi:hypothetical protein [Kribbella sp. NPDC051770]|uniref:hypothetical protein n=1 Tax=Kribbella sp. NPDC051770 TaxID=3155413 RepID=UPI0034281EF7